MPLSIKRGKLWITLLTTFRKPWIGPHIALNPIEILWANLKERLRKQMFSWKNLEEKLLEIWNNIDEETVANLYESMKNRIGKVSQVRGAPIGY